MKTTTNNESSDLMTRILEELQKAEHTNGKSLLDVDPSVLYYENLILRAIRKDGSHMQYAHSTLKESVDFWIKYISYAEDTNAPLGNRQNAYDFLPEVIRKSRDAAKKLILMDAQIINYFDTSTKLDGETVLDAISHGKANVFQHLNDDDANNKLFAIECLRVSPSVYLKLKHDFIFDEDIIRVAYDRHPLTLLSTLPSKIFDEVFVEYSRPELLKYFFERCPASIFHHITMRKALDGTLPLLLNLLKNEPESYFLSALEHMDVSGIFTDEDHKLSKRKLLVGYDVTIKQEYMVLFVLSKLTPKTL